MNYLTPVGEFLQKSAQYVAEKATRGNNISLSEHNFEEFGPLIELNDRIAMELAEGLSEEDTKAYELEPPRVIVVGLTSAGKSSLLARVIGHKIFPVKDSVCTRRPFRVQLKKESGEEKSAKLRFLGADSGGGQSEFALPEDLNDVRQAIETKQMSGSDEVNFSSREITAEISAPNNPTFTFTDLPGIFLVSEAKMGADYAESRRRNEALKKQTEDIIKKYMKMKNTIVLVVISATDWMHGMNNDNLIGCLAEWLEEIRNTEKRHVPVYGVITKLDTQKSGLSENSPIKKVLTNTLAKDHILNGLGVRKWIPVVCSPAVLALGSGEEAAKLEHSAVSSALSSSLPASVLQKLPIGRSHLLKELKQALLHSISLSYTPMRKGVDKFVCDLDAKLKKLPVPAALSEKRRMFDSGLNLLENTLNDLVGAQGRHPPSQLGQRSLRMQLMVDTPQAFEDGLNAISLQGDVNSEVEQILNQAALEQGGSFDSDRTFSSLSKKIISRMQGPCLHLVDSSCRIVSEALCQATHTAFGDYKLLNELIQAELGVAGSVRGLDALSEAQDIAGQQSLEQLKFFQVLTHSAKHKVLNLLDSLGTMACFHPMWRNFDQLYHQVLLKQASKQAASHKKDDSEVAVQDMLKLPELAKVAKEEGEAAIVNYEKETGTRMSESNKIRVAKHFARVEVMAYIVRMSLISTVFPLVLRDVRDGLFSGINFCGKVYDYSVSSLLRHNLVFDPKMEKIIFAYMEPSPEDAQQREVLVAKRSTLLSLKQQFQESQSKLTRLMQLFEGGHSHSSPSTPSSTAASIASKSSATPPANSNPTPAPFTPPG
jgi:GTP-binding protein EngB required for normal cell division|mmetsp:Transcript_35839/g.70405  ORF Transcript_35839/g.70405 Transcript_35839/m.70405 type:complete len:825 (+) Transcript_35839:70-2544(+)